MTDDAKQPAREVQRWTPGWSETEALGTPYVTMERLDPESSRPGWYSHDDYAALEAERDGFRDLLTDATGDLYDTRNERDTLRAENETAKAEGRREAFDEAAEWLVGKSETASDWEDYGAESVLNNAADHFKALAKEQA